MHDFIYWLSITGPIVVGSTILAVKPMFDPLALALLLVGVILSQVAFYAYRKRLELDQLEVQK